MTSDEPPPSVEPLDFLIPVLQHAADIAFYDALGSELESRGVRVGFVTLSRGGTETLAARHPNVFYLYEGFDRDAVPSLDEILAIEERYRLGNIRDHVYAERSYYGGDDERVVARAVHTFRFVERLVIERRVGAFLNNVGGELVRRTMARIGDTGTPGGHRPRNIIIDFAPIHGRIAVTTDEMTWDGLPARAPELSAERRAEVEALVREATTRRRMFSTPVKLGVNLGSFYRPFKNAWHNLVSEGGQYDYDPVYVYAERARNVVRRGVNRVFYQQPVDGERYLFFPLHDPKDSALTVRAPQFQNQEDVVSFAAARALPTGHVLYVKPHPAALDSYPVGMLARLRSLPNVRLLDPRINSHQLIEGAAAVLVINSTVGFEALLYGRPVVVLGRVFYRGRGVTTDIENVAELPTALRRAVHTPVDREAILRFLGACLDASYPGVFGNAAPDNLRIVADALLDKARRVGLRPGQ